MGKNVEIKAYAIDFIQQSEIARSLSGEEPEVIYQKDIFFNVPKGRLKLRILAKNLGVLIYYNRSDQQGPKISQYECSKTNDPESLESLLTSAYGIRGVVVKKRELYVYENTRIHFDRVESLGEFIELEIVLSDPDTLIDSKKEAQRIMNKLGIIDSQLIDVAYVDLLNSKECVYTQTT